MNPLWQWMSWVVPLCCATATACAVLGLARLPLAWPVKGVVSRHLPWWLRWHWRPAQWLAKLLRGTAFAARLHGLQAQLARCDLDDVLDPPDWFTVRLLVMLSSAGAAAAVCLLLSASMALPVTIAAAVGWRLTGRWLRELRLAREMLILKELPASLDVLTLCVEAGATLTAALRMVVDKSPPTPLRAVFERVLREVRAGRTRLEALEHVAAVYRLDCLDALVSALLQSEGAGVSLGGLLRAQSEQRSAERHLRAERLALQAPVKMLGPLVLCIFPCTFVVISVPIVARLLQVSGP